MCRTPRAGGNFIESVATMPAASRHFSGSLVGVGSGEFSLDPPRKWCFGVFCQGSCGAPGWEVAGCDIRHVPAGRPLLV
jgi:hypothetical protein